MLHSHKIRLVGVDGQEQSVIFNIESEGVHLLTQKAQVSLAHASPDMPASFDRHTILNRFLAFAASGEVSL